MVKTKNFAEKIITLLFLFFFSIPALAEDKTAITEFKINAEKEFEYLQTAIPEMFFSRLPYKNKEIVKTNDIKNLFNNGFNMVITGSYTKLGNAFSLDVRVHKKDEVKFVISDENDFLWAKDIIIKYNLIERVAAVLVSPAFGLIEPRKLAELILSSSLNIRLQLQIHKYIWEPNTRGV